MNALLLDIGNSRLKWNTHDGLRLKKPTQSFDWHQTDPLNYFQQQWGELPVPDTVWVSSVAGKHMDKQLTQWCKLAGWPLEFAMTTEEFDGITNAYDNPTQLGVDRWMALIGAKELAQTLTGQRLNDLCVIDCGTAITLDVLASDGRHLGGLIAPGLDLMRQSLRIAPGISINDDFDVNLLARNTTDGVYNGTMNMAVAFVERTIQQLEEQLDRPLVRIITGGAGGLISAHLSGNYHHEADLVLQGLAVVAGRSSL